MVINKSFKRNKWIAQNVQKERVSFKFYFCLIRKFSREKLKKSIRLQFHRTWMRNIVTFFKNLWRCLALSFTKFGVIAILTNILDSYSTLETTLKLHRYKNYNFETKVFSKFQLFILSFFKRAKIFYNALTALTLRIISFYDILWQVCFKSTVPNHGSQNAKRIFHIATKSLERFAGNMRHFWDTYIWACRQHWSQSNPEIWQWTLFGDHGNGGNTLVMGSPFDKPPEIALVECGIAHQWPM